jgi:hypothetical protein
MTRFTALTVGLLCASALAAPVLAQSAVDETNPYLRDRTIAYALTDRDWGVYQTADAKAECPNGMAEWGPREQFKALYQSDGKERTVEETILKRESEIWHPSIASDQFVYKEAGGKTAVGLNLDGKVDANDFTNPDGVPGVDNELFRVIGCTENFRGPGGIVMLISNQLLKRLHYNRMIIELTEVDSLADDNDVTVTIYRGRDALLMDATGKRAVPGGTQRLDRRWGKSFTQRLKGKIEGGVLITATQDIKIPYAVRRQNENYYKNAQLNLRLTPERAEGVLGGYVDVEDWYSWLIRNWATVYQSYGRVAAHSVYQKLHARADALPDQNGKNTAISAAARMSFTQVYIERPDPTVALAPGGTTTTAASVRE